MSGRCHGNGVDHCCYWGGAPPGPGPNATTVDGVCPFLAKNAVGTGRRWSCGLFNELHDWTLVHTDPRYLAVVQPLWRNSSVVYDQLWQAGVRCGSWPDGVATLKAGEVAGKPALRALRDAFKTVIDASLITGYVNQCTCCWGGQPVAP